MKLFIDDVRTPPENWFWAKNSRQGLDYIYWHLFDLTHISFDHDLGGSDTSRVVALKLEELSLRRWLPPIVLTVHSANPVGRQWLEASIRNIERWSER
jgi:hypothetical protein